MYQIISGHHNWETIYGSQLTNCKQNNDFGGFLKDDITQDFHIFSL